jgi:putative ABC transport system permease protein
MFLRVVKESFARNRRRKLIAVAAVTVGACVTTAMLAVAIGIGDKVNRELRSYGANIEALPVKRPLNLNAGGVEIQAAGETSRLRQQDLPGIKSVFWAHNILAFAPFVYSDVRIAGPDPNGNPIPAKVVGTWFDHDLPIEGAQLFRTGILQVRQWWKVRGNWPQERECLVGEILAERLNAHPGDQITLISSEHELRLRVSGILATGAEEDDRVITHLDLAQSLAGAENGIDRVEVSALTNPEDDFARMDPETMSPQDYERWTCTPYARSIAHDLEKALDGSEAHPVLRISQNEGTLLSRIDLMMLLITAAALAAAVLGVGSTMTTTVLERKSEIALLKAIGASNTGVVAIFLAEAALVGLAGGTAGLAGGYWLAQIISRSVFNSPIEISAVLVPLVLAIALLVTFAGSVLPLRAALRFEPSLVLRGH